MGLNIAITSKYDPFTYEDYIKPLKEYWDDYDKHEAAIGELETNAEALNYIIEAEPEDSPLRPKFEAYKNQLMQATQALSDGFNNKDRELLRGLRSAFSRDIAPIATGYKRRQDMEDEQRKLQTSNPSIYFSKTARGASVSDFVNNPNWSYDSFSGDAIMKKVQEMVGPLADATVKLSQGDDYGNYMSIFKNYGVSQDDVFEYMNTQTGRLADIFKLAEDKAVQAYGIDKWNDEAALNTAYEYARMGLPKAIGKQNMQFLVSKEKDEDGGGEGSIASLYPGRALNFDISVPSASTESHDASKKNSEYVQSLHVAGKDIIKSAEEESLEAQIRESGLSIDELDKYNIYLKELNTAKTQDRLESDPQTSLRTGVNTNESRVREKYPEFKGIKLDKKIIDEYNTAKSKRSALLGRYLNTQAKEVPMAGVYTGNLLDDIHIGTALEERQSRREITVGEPTWTDETMKDVATKLLNTYRNMASAGIVKPKGNGLYEVNLQTGEENYIKPNKISEDLLKDPRIVFTSDYGMLLTDGKYYYKIKGNRTIDDINKIGKIEESLRDFSPETLNEYYSSVGTAVAAPIDKSPVEYNEKEAYNLALLLNQNRLLQPDKKNPSNMYAFVTVTTGRGNHELWKVLFDRSGKLLGSTSLSSELGNGTPLSTQFAFQWMENAAGALTNRLINKHLDPTGSAKTWPQQ